MGTDIHGFVEHKVDGKWQLVAVETVCSWCGGSAFDKHNNEPCYHCTKHFKTPGKQIGYGDRHYLLFSILAGIRNYPKIDSISENRGLPDDVSDELKQIGYKGDETEKYGEYDLGDHSMSWVSLKELVDYDWTQPIKNGDKVSTHAEVCDHFYNHFIPALKLLDSDYNNVRLVFDSTHKPYIMYSG